MLRNIHIVDKLAKWTSKELLKSWHNQKPNLVILGDLGNPLDNDFRSKISVLTKKHKRVILIPGQEELYDPEYAVVDMYGYLYSLSKEMGTWEVLNNRHVDIDGVKVFGSTLWYEPQSELDLYNLPKMYKFDTDGIESLQPMTKFELERMHNVSYRSYLRFLDKYAVEPFISATYFRLPGEPNHRYVYARD